MPGLRRRRVRLPTSTSPRRMSAPGSRLPTRSPSGRRPRPDASSLLLDRPFGLGTPHHRSRGRTARWRRRIGVGTPVQVADFDGRGVEPDRVMRLLVATGGLSAGSCMRSLLGALAFLDMEHARRTPWIQRVRPGVERIACDQGGDETPREARRRKLGSVYEVQACARGSALAGGT